MNERLKVYLDTSVISYLKQDDAPEKTKITNDLWEKFKTGIFDIYFSQVTITEMNECPIDKLNVLKNKLEEIQYTKLILNVECFNLAKEIITIGILTEKSLDDSYHIATAVVNECDVIVSWNFKHLVNVKTIDGVRAITLLKRYKNINIVDPLTLLEMEV
ncbi:MAG: PIN domain nuclease [Eubacteriales bacterium]|nr:PIN domain nuclease [Eubacteriales bacterium]